MKNNKDYNYWVKLASSAAVLAAMSMIVVKAYAWLITDSAAILASLTDSFFDVAASVFNFFVLRYSLAPADEEHKFGHGKAESLGALAQAAFIAGSATLLMFHSFGRLSNPQTIQGLEVGVGATLFAILATLILVLIQRVAVSKTNSVAIKADSLHYKGDLIMNVAVLVALGLTYWGYPAMDAWFAIGIAFYLLHSAWEIGNQAVQSLMDRELAEEDVERIQQLATSHSEVIGAHDIRTRQSGKTQFIQFHLELPDQLILVEAHRITDDVEKIIKEAFPEADVLIHQDPISVVNKN